MNRLIQITVGILATLVFVSAGLWILQWSAGSISTTRQAADWPTVEGRVLESWLDSRGEPTPHVLYSYVVEDRGYRSEQIGLDIFHKPGGRGTARARAERYPVRSVVQVHHHPDRPELAVLETGDLSPFLMPTIFGLLFSAGGMLMGIKTFRYAAGSQPTPASSAVRAPWLALGVSALLYILVVVISFESSVREVQQQAMAGWSPLGLSPTAFFLLAETALFAPIPWLLLHVIRLGQATSARVSGLASLGAAVVSGLREGGERGRSARVVIAGAVYLALVLGGWIVFTAVRGI